MKELIQLETTFVSSARTQFALFRDISETLVKQQLVTPEFLPSIIAREKLYPTGLPLTPIHRQLPNIALPHTDSSSVKTTRIIPIKLKTPIIFQNMIQPKEPLTVTFLFMLLNADETQQASLLATLMDYLRNTDYQQLLLLFTCTKVEQIFQILSGRADESKLTNKN